MPPQRRVPPQNVRDDAPLRKLIRQITRIEIPDLVSKILGYLLARVRQVKPPRLRLNRSLFYFDREPVFYETDNSRRKNLVNVLQRQGRFYADRAFLRYRLTERD